MWLKVGSSISALVIIQNESRGAGATFESLINVASRNFASDIAYCGARLPENEDPYSSKLKFRWEFSEPARWETKLKQTLPEGVFRYFLETGGNGLATSNERVQLWTSGFIQAFYRSRALEKIIELGLEKSYKWFFFVRPDYFFINPIPNASALGSNGLVTMAGDQYGGLNDRFLGVPASLIHEAAKLTDYSGPENKLEDLKDFMGANPYKNPESLLYFQVREGNLLPTLVKIGQLGYCVRLPGDGSRWSAGFWSAKREVFVKYPTEVVLAKVARIFGPTSAALGWWSRFLEISAAQPRLLLAFLLVLLGDFQLAQEVWKKSGREHPSTPKQLVADLGRVFGSSNSNQSKSR